MFQKRKTTTTTTKHQQIGKKFCRHIEDTRGFTQKFVQNRAHFERYNPVERLGQIEYSWIQSIEQWKNTHTATAFRMQPGISPVFPPNYREFASTTHPFCSSNKSYFSLFSFFIKLISFSFFSSSIEIVDIRSTFGCRSLPSAFLSRICMCVCHIDQSKMIFCDFFHMRVVAFPPPNQICPKSDESEHCFRTMGHTWHWYTDWNLDLFENAKQKYSTNSTSCKKPTHQITKNENRFLEILLYHLILLSQDTTISARSYKALCCSSGKCHTLRRANLTQPLFLSVCLSLFLSHQTIFFCLFLQRTIISIMALFFMVYFILFV